MKTKQQILDHIQILQKNIDFELRDKQYDCKAVLVWQAMINVLEWSLADE